METHASSSVQAMSGGTPETAGRFRYDATTDSWWWSDELYTIYGFVPGSVIPTTDLFVAHADPDDIDQSMHVIKDAIAEGRPFSSYHRVIDARRRSRKVLVAGHATNDGTGQLLRIEGYVVDLTEARRRDAKEEVHSAITGVMEGRAEIEQAKGVLMVAYGVDAEQAFGLLVARSQQTNRKLRDVARCLMAGLGDEPLARARKLRQELTGLLDEVASRLSGLDRSPDE
jgi:hypothetical protein